MHVGDLVKITLKDNPDLFVSGVIKSVEDDYVYAIATTFRGDIVLDEDFNVEVLRVAEPTKVGSVHFDKNGTRWTRFTDKERYLCHWIDDDGNIHSWEYVGGKR